MLDDKLLEITESLVDKVNEKDWDEYSINIDFKDIDTDKEMNGHE